MRHNKKNALAQIAILAGALASTNIAHAEEPKDATAQTQAFMENVAQTEPFSDREDFDLAARGFIASFPEDRIYDDQGRMIRYFNSEFFAGTAPDTVNPSLWRDAQLVAKVGLFMVADGIYQVRGLDISNMSVIIGDTGYILVDPLVSVETARAALRLVRSELGDRPVTGVIYTHSHLDHFGGSAGVVSHEDAASGNIPVLAPAGFMREVISENVIAGPAMSRRIEYMSGAPLQIGPRAAVSSGIGPSFARDPEAPGTISLVAPNKEIQNTGDVEIIDGVRFEFQLTPGSEAPAEMNIYLPEKRALLAAENANGTLHNILTPRGALVRNAKDWADYLTETIALYGEKTDVLFTSHFWPRWGDPVIVDYLSSHRDMYKYLHDQSVRMMNKGLNGAEIGAQIALPQPLAERWFNHEYYGTMSFNAHAVYQRYMGWYDGNPVNLNPIPRAQAGSRYVEAMGGAENVISMAQSAFDAGEYQWASELLTRVVFADRQSKAARTLLADSLEQLGYQAESAVWRNMYLSGAQDLRLEEVPSSRFESTGGTLAALPLSDLLDALAVRLVPKRALDAPMRFVLSLGENDAELVEIRNGVLIHYPAPEGIEAQVFPLERQHFLEMIFSPEEVSAEGSGEDAAIRDFARLFDKPKPNFGLVLPNP